MFKHGLTGYLGCLNTDLPEIMDQAGQEANSIDFNRLNDKATCLTKQLSLIFSMLCKGKTLGVLKKVERQRHGLLDDT